MSNDTAKPSTHFKPENKIASAIKNFVKLETEKVKYNPNHKIAFDGKPKANPILDKLKLSVKKKGENIAKGKKNTEVGVNSQIQGLNRIANNITNLQVCHDKRKEEVEMSNSIKEKVEQNRKYA